MAPKPRRTAKTAPQLAEGVLHFDRSTWTPKRRHLLWNTWQVPQSSFGYVTTQLVLALHELGVEMFILAQQPEANWVDPTLRAVLQPNPTLTTWAVQHDSPMAHAPIPVENRLRYTMWEWDVLPPGWAHVINTTNKILAVPTRQQAKLFADSGVTLPIHVVGHGVDPVAYAYRRPVPSPVFTFGTMGHLSARKGVDVLIKAFKDEFPDEEDVQLIIKAGQDEASMEMIRMRVELPDDARVRWRFGHVSDQAIGDLLGTFDVGVFPSRGEGFGLGGLQTMAVGRTVICTGKCGMGDYLAPAYNFALDADLKPYPYSFSRLLWPNYHPSWLEPSYEHLRELLRYCYEHRDEVRAKGLAASRWVHRHWTWKRAAQQLVKAIDRYRV